MVNGQSLTRGVCAVEPKLVRRRSDVGKHERVTERAHPRAAIEVHVTWPGVAGDCKRAHYSTGCQEILARGGYVGRLGGGGGLLLRALLHVLEKRTVARPMLASRGLELLDLSTHYTVAWRYTLSGSSVPPRPLLLFIVGIGFGGRASRASDGDSGGLLLLALGLGLGLLVGLAPLLLSSSCKDCGREVGRSLPTTLERDLECTGSFIRLQQRIGCCDGLVRDAKLIVTKPHWV